MKPCHVRRTLIIFVGCGSFGCQAGDSVALKGVIGIRQIEQVNGLNRFRVCHDIVNRVMWSLCGTDGTNLLGYRKKVHVDMRK